MIIMTGPRGNLAFCDRSRGPKRASGFDGHFHTPKAQSFASQPIYACNHNFAPQTDEHDEALDLLYDIAGVRETGMMMY